MDKALSREGVEKLKEFRDQLLRGRGGVPFENSVELLREAREERDRELGLLDEEDSMLEAHPVNPEMFEKIMVAREQIFHSTDGQQFEDTTEVIRRMREERLRQLTGEE